MCVCCRDSLDLGRDMTGIDGVFGETLYSTHAVSHYSTLDPPRPSDS